MLDHRSRGSPRLGPRIPAMGRLDASELVMKDNHKSWLQLYVDAMTERDPYRRLALVRELRRMPRQKESDDFLDGCC